MCKHVAAALYGAGARLDAEPELLFRLRAVDAGEIFANLDAALPASRGGGAGTRLDAQRSFGYLRHRYGGVSAIA